MNYESSVALIRTRIEASIGVKQQILVEPGLVEQIGALADRIVAVLKGGGKLLLFGNGGSAADAQHIAAELIGHFGGERRPLPAIALTTDTSILTALGNDYGFADVFARQVEALGHPGDIVLGLSTSGASVNVARGLEAAGASGLFTVALTGAKGGWVSTVAAECVRVPSNDTPRIQEAHIMIGHILCEIIDRALAGSES